MEIGLRKKFQLGDRVQLMVDMRNASRAYIIHFFC